MPHYNICRHRVCDSVRLFRNSPQLAFVDPVCQLRTCSSGYRPTREGEKGKDGGGDLSMVLRTYSLVRMSIDTGVWTRGRDLRFEIFLCEVRITEGNNICNQVKINHNGQK